MTLAAASYALAFLFYGSLVVVLAATGSREDRAAAGRRALLVASLLSAAWGLASTLTLVLKSPWASLASGVLDLGRYAAWFAFLLFLLRVVWAPRRWRGGLIACAAIVGLVIAGVVVAPVSTGDWRVVLARNLPLAFLALPLMGLFLVEQVYRGAVPDARWQLRPLGLALASVFLFDVYLHAQVLLFARIDEDSLAVRGIAHALPALLLYMAVQRADNWRVPFQVSRQAALHTATLTLAGVFLLLLAGAGYYVRNLGGEWGGALQIALLSIGLIGLAALLLSSDLRARLRVLVSKHFFRYRYDYREEWLRFTARLSAAKSPQEVGEFVIRGLAEMLHCPAGALWYRDAASHRFTQTVRWKAAADSQEETDDSPFVRFVAEREWVVDLDESRADPAKRLAEQVPDWMLQRAGYWLVVPLMVGDELRGFVVLERSLASTQLNWEVRDLLKNAGRQAAGVLAMMEATEALLEARKFDAFNRMSAFVVHDLKNIVAQLSLMMQNARRLKDNEEFQQDMFATVENSLERLRRLMLQLRSGETPAQAVSGVGLPRVVDRIAAAARARGRQLEVEVVDGVSTRGHEDRIERVLGHIVDNALDATESKGSVRVSLEREGSQAKITVRDSGQGMSEEFVRSRLFKPFSSTKNHGMGIGAYESRQYIQEIGGSLTVESELGHGTVVVVRLPLFEPGHSSASTLYSNP